MQLPPLDVIAGWPTPNYENPVTRNPANAVMNLVLFPLVCLVVGLRIYTRLRISKSFGVDDWLILASMFPATAFAIISLIAETGYGWNRHVWDVDPATLPLGLKLAMTTDLLFSAATTLTKCSMLTLTYRIVSNGSKRFSWFIIGAIIFIVADSMSFFFIIIFRCSPISDYWTLSFKPQHCLSEIISLLIASIINTVTDMLVVVLPIPIVWGLKLPRQQQVILVLLFGAGLLSTVAGAVKTVYLYEYTRTWDRTWMAYPVWLAGSVELYVGIICASIPATKKFFSRYVPKLLGSNFLVHESIPSFVDLSGIMSTNPSRSYFGDEDIEMYIGRDSPRSDVEQFKESGVHVVRKFHSYDTSLNFSGEEGTASQGSITSTRAYGLFEPNRMESQEDLVVSPTQYSRDETG